MKTLILTIVLFALSASSIAANHRPDSKDQSHQGVTICHKGHTITVDDNALQAHLNHGDSEGTCPESNEAAVTPNVPEMTPDVTDVTPNVPGDTEVVTNDTNLVSNNTDSSSQDTNLVSNDTNLVSPTPVVNALPSTGSGPSSQTPMAAAFALLALITGSTAIMAQRRVQE